jgi:hypothetical protein
MSHCNTVERAAGSTCSTDPYCNFALLSLPCNTFLKDPLLVLLVVVNKDVKKVAAHRIANPLCFDQL